MHLMTMPRREKTMTNAAWVTEERRCCQARTEGVGSITISRVVGTSTRASSDRHTLKGRSVPGTYAVGTCSRDACRLADQAGSGERGQDANKK